jgi:Na+/H+-dicarboxylate symporter
MERETRDWLIDQHRESYRYQLEQRDKIYDRVSFLSTPLTLLGAGIIYLTTNTPRGWHPLLPLWFYVPIVVAACFFILALLLIIFTLTWNFRYGYAVTPRELQDYALAFVRYAESSEIQSPDVLGTIKAKLGQQYCDAASHNSAVNYRRRNLISLAMKLSASAFLALLLSLPAFFVGKSAETDSPTKVIITQPIRIQP